MRDKPNKRTNSRRSSSDDRGTRRPRRPARDEFGVERRSERSRKKSQSDDKPRSRGGDGDRDRRPEKRKFPREGSESSGSPARRGNGSAYRNTRSRGRALRDGASRELESRERGLRDRPRRSDKKDFRRFSDEENVSNQRITKSSSGSSGREANIRESSPVKIKPKSDTIRLQKFLAECGLGSRRKTEQLIVEGRVQVNGKVVNELGSKVNPFTDRVEVNRKPVKLAPKGVMLLNKPRGVVSTLSDPEGRPTIADFLTKHYRSYFPVGRLDWDSTGLMLLTNDGELAELLMHPRYQFDRVYHARVEGSVSEELLKKFEKGIKLRDGVAYGVARIVGNNDATTWVEIRVREGRNRLVRRMFDEIGHSVVKLKRVEYGPFRLGKLDVGEVRPLTEKEYVQVRRKVFSEVSSPKVELNTQSISKAKEIRKRSKKKGRTRLE
jgi:23S rRNA pseudouridine2605 synthase